MKHRLPHLVFKPPLKKGLLFAMVGLVLVPSLLALAYPQPVSALSTSQIMKDALDACNTSDSHNECVTGYINGYNGQSSQAVCTQWVGTPNYNPCVRGINLGRAAANNAPVDPPVPTNDPSTPSKAAQSFCAGKTGKAAAVCADGYDGQTNGKSKQDACKGDSGNLLTVCQNAWDQSQTDAQNAAANNNSPPTCESGGFNLSWIFCPVIEGLASAVDGIYSSLIQPLLRVNPIDISNSKNDPTHAYAIWSSFRVYGDVLLIIALLVVVFGESIGGGLIDAYTAKKILPRLLVAAVLINISIFIVAFAVDISNIAGNGIQTLIQAPFNTAACASQNQHFSAGQSCFALNISGAAADVGGLGVIGLVGGGAGGIWAATAGSAIAAGILWPLLEFLLIFILIPALFAFVAILATLLFRQGLILFLLLISPIAFALYCLPNTEQYFRRWWDLLLKTLLIYPLIAVIFALANVLSVTIDSTTTGIAKPFADFLAIMALLSPLFLIPFSFKIAGGVLGQLHEFAHNAGKRGSEAIKGNQQDPWSWRNRNRYRLGAGVSRVQQRLIDQGERQPGSSFQPGRGRRAASRVAGFGLFGNPDMRASKWNKLLNETEETMSQSGRDNLRYAAAGYKVAPGEAALDGSVANHDRWFNAKGAEIDKGMHDRAKRFFTGDTTAGAGASLEYAFRKANGPEDVAAARFSFAQNAKDNDWNGNEMVDVWAQATFPHKDKYLSEWYSTPTPTDGKSGRAGVTFQDVGTNIDSYGKMMKEAHGIKAAHQWSSVRAQDWHAIHDRTQATQDKLSRGEQISNDEATHFAQAHEIMDGMVRSGYATQQQNDQGETEIVASGASAEVQGLISAISKAQKGYDVVSPEPNNTGGLNPVSDRIIEREQNGQKTTVAVARNVSPGREAIISRSTQ